MRHGPFIFSNTFFLVTISIFFSLFHPSIDCSLVDTKFLEVFERVFFAFVHMKLMKIGNYSFKWFFTISIHFELKKLIATFSQGFFYKISKNWKRKFLHFGPLLENQQRYRPIQHLKMTVRISVS